MTNKFIAAVIPVEKNAIVQPFVLLEGRNPGQWIRKEFQALNKSQTSVFLKDIIVLRVC